MGLRSSDTPRLVPRRAAGGFAVMLLSVAACAPSSPSSPPTVDFYRAHSAERTAELARCGNDPGERALTPSCVNAREAARQEGLGSLRTLPPMGLPVTPPDRTRTP
jgi:hypothetical protein